MNSLTIVDRAADILDGFRSDLEPILIDSGKSYDRLRAVFLIAVQQDAKILDCSAESLRREISKCAADGLVPDAKEAVLLPYWDAKQSRYLANYQPMVHGIIKRLRELGGVFSITCKLVYAEDEFILNEADPDSLAHRSDPFSKDRGEIVGGYAVFRDDQKRVMHLETMSSDDFEKVRRASKAPNSPAWVTWGDQMRLKAVLRRGSKYLSINNDKIRALLERQDEMFEFQKARTTAADRMNPFGGSEALAQEKSLQIEHRPQDSIILESSVPNERVTTENTVDNVVREDRPSPNKMKTEVKKVGNKAPTAVTDVSINPNDRETVVRACEEILAISLKPGLSPQDRKDELSKTSQGWSSDIPESARPLIKSCIDMTTWSIKQMADEKPWTGDHMMFVQCVKELLEVQRLTIGSYP